jgi:acetyl esterase/lipase
MVSVKKNINLLNFSYYHLVAIFLLLLAIGIYYMLHFCNDNNTIENIPYGEIDESNQFIRIYPADDVVTNNVLTNNVDKKFPVVYLIHGGFWRAKWNIDNSQLINTVPYFTARGFNVCAIEYRRCGQNNGGGLCGTLDDYISGLKKLYRLSKCDKYSYLDMDKVTVLGHSSGGHAVLWLCSQRTRNLPFKLVQGVALAPICDLIDASLWLRNGDYPVANFLATIGQPNPEVICNKDKSICEGSESVNTNCVFKALLPLPLHTPVTIVQGTADVIVPVDHVRQFVNQATTSSVPIKYVELEGKEHFDLVNITTSYWPYIASQVK